jgi:hypothetical protein
MDRLGMVRIPNCSLLLIDQFLQEPYVNHGTYQTMVHQNRRYPIKIDIFGSCLIFNLGSSMNYHQWNPELNLFKLNIGCFMSYHNAELNLFKLNIGCFMSYHNAELNLFKLNIGCFMSYHNAELNLFKLNIGCFMSYHEWNAEMNSFNAVSSMNYHPWIAELDVVYSDLISLMNSHQ